MTENRTGIDEDEDADAFLVSTHQPGQHGAAIRVEVRGDLDLYTAPSFSKALEDACSNYSRGQENATTLLVDMREVRFIDSGGLAVLLHQHQQLGVACPMTLLIRPGTQVARILKLTQIDRLFTITDSPTG